MSEHFIVEDDFGPDLEFEGELLLNEQFHDIGAIRVYRTAAGTLIARRLLSSRPGVVLKDETKLFESAEALAEWLGFSPGAKAVRQKLGLPTTRHID